MGEIADALRQAREAPPAPDARRGGAAGVPGTRLPAGRAFPAGPPEGAPADGPGEVLDTLEAADPSIALASEATLEGCRGVAVNVRAELELMGARSFAVVSAVRDEGKTLAACNLALAMASLSDGRRLAVVDLDLRSPSIAPVLGIAPELGMEDVLAGTAELDDVKITVRSPAIDIFPGASPIHTAHELLVQPRLREVIQALEARYPIVVVDTPPCLIVSDTKLIMQHVATCVPIARVGFSRAKDFRQLLEMLPKDRVLGELLTGARLPRHGYDYYYDKSNRQRAKGRVA